IATGLAFAAKYKKEDRVTLCFLGDGALNEGEFHECLNLASVWDLPIIFFCENNLYGMGAPVWETFAAYEEIYKFASAYKVHGLRVDGMDLLAVRETTQAAVEHVIQGEGPVFVEAQTYRFRGHSIADPAEYRQRRELDTWLARDPVVHIRAMLLDWGASAQEVDEIDRAVEAQVEGAVRFADESPWPDPSALYEDVYAPEGPG
ncbi:MAG: thiamine pyrophosphate-dependent enzyme, partial [Chloroflexota bacterium]|nr:thiamine pyrophosphate-dependent enzyme [Chloroflexota bacterium]